MKTAQENSGAGEGRRSVSPLVAVPVGVFILGWGFEVEPVMRGAVWAAVVLAVGVGVVRVVRAWVDARRARARAMHEVLCARTNTFVGNEKWTRVRSWQPLRVWHRYEPAVFTPGEEELAQLAVKVSAHVGRPVRVERAGQNALRVVEGAHPQPLVARTDTADKMRAELEPRMRAPLRVTVDDDTDPRLVRVQYPAGFDDHEDERRAEVVERVNAKLPGPPQLTQPWRWGARWDTGSNVVELYRRPELPARVPLPEGWTDQWRLPVGIDEDHARRVWDLKATPHALICGPTGSGKTVALRTIVTAALQAGIEVVGVDPKRLELVGFRGHPGVLRVATTVEDMVDAVSGVHALMEQRYDETEQAILDGWDKDEWVNRYTPLLLVIDEQREWVQRLTAAWRADDGRGEHPAIEEFRSIARLGRAARIHMLVGIQRPDAKQFGGEARDNMRFRVAVGAMSPQGLRMMFDRSDVGRDIPDGLHGRMTVQVGDRTPVEVQGYYTDPPTPRSDPEPPPARVPGDRWVDPADTDDVVGGWFWLPGPDGSDTAAEVTTTACEDGGVEVTYRCGDGFEGVMFFDDGEQMRVAERVVSDQHATV